jgi:SAM-dependent methyltransferase
MPVPPTTRVVRAFRKMLRSVRSRGLIETARSLVRLVGARSQDRRAAFDRDLGVDTAGFDPLWSLVDDPDMIEGGNPYHPVDELDLERALKSLTIDPLRFDFIDVGCGKGRALLVASRFGFRRLIGVEYVPVLAEVAKENLKRLNIGNATVVECDARQYSFDRDPAVVFLFNPFGRSILETVVERMLTAAGPELYIVYCVPGHRDVFEETGQFEKTAEFFGERSADMVTTWKRLPSRR